MSQLANINLALKVRKPILKLGFINNLDLAKELNINIFLNFTLPILLLQLSTLLMMLPLLTNIRSLTKSSTFIVFSIKVSETII